MKAKLLKSTQEQASTFLASLNRIDILRDRARMLAKVRAFFEQRDVLEVDCPIMTRFASVDAHIDLIRAEVSISDQAHYLHSSPEYGMKRLLSEGIGDIYQLSHVFRDGETGQKHNPEFTMIEWYRHNFTYQEMIEETLEVIRLFLGDLPKVQMTYKQAMLHFAEIDSYALSTKDLLVYAKTKDISLYEGIEKEGKDAVLNLILSTQVEPHLGFDSLFVLTHYPETQAALARTEIIGDERCALRYEIYYQGVELANGYHELTDYAEQRNRFLLNNEERLKNGKEALPIDEFFLDALKRGLPECCGVAVGFDRLMMLRHNQSEIASVIPFSWKTA